MAHCDPIIAARDAAVAARAQAEIELQQAQVVASQKMDNFMAWSMTVLDLEAQVAACEAEHGAPGPP